MINATEKNGEIFYIVKENQDDVWENSAFFKDYENALNYAINLLLKCYADYCIGEDPSEEEIREDIINDRYDDFISISKEKFSD